MPTLAILGVVHFVGCLPAFFAIDTLGRRALLLWGAAAMGACMVAQAALSYAAQREGAAGGAGGGANASALALEGWGGGGDPDAVTLGALIGAVVVYIATYASTWGVAACVCAAQRPRNRLVRPTCVRVI